MIGKEYLVGAHLRCWFIFYDDPRDADMVMLVLIVFYILNKKFINRCKNSGIFVDLIAAQPLPFLCRSYGWFGFLEITASYFS